MMKTNYFMSVTTGQQFDIASFIDGNTDTNTFVLLLDLNVVGVFTSEELRGN